MKPEIKNFLNQLSRSHDVTQAAVADNCRFDERAAPARWDAFEDQLPVDPNWSE